MKLLVDSALSPEIARLLAQRGHDALHARDLGLLSASDETVFEAAVHDGRVIVSADTDFGTLLALREATAPSVVLFRHTSTRRPTLLADLLADGLPEWNEHLERGAIVTIDEGRVRIRSLPIVRR